MKNKRIKIWLDRMILTLWAVLPAFLSLAQDGGGSGGGGNANVSITTKSTSSDTWYSSPWVWVVGAAVFILLLVALLSRGRRSD